MEEKKTKRTTTKRSKKPVEAVEVEIQEAPKTFTGIVATDKLDLNVRAKASSESAVVKQLKKGSKVELFADPVDGFYKLADKSGFVLAAKIKK
jgi:uncharacterized protein YgiM (DUF1202 family)